MATEQPSGRSKLPAAEWTVFATKRTTLPSAQAPTTRQCFSLSRGNLVALETSLPLKTGTQFFVGQSSIANRVFAIALEHGRFNSTLAQLLLTICANRVALRQCL